ncbi:MAG: hypothetical protein JWL67_1156 [Solirubrobacterales bacterium]|nr:hypothetical protein [Solirubrobacterales bacterium]
MTNREQAVIDSGAPALRGIAGRPADGRRPGAPPVEDREQVGERAARGSLRAQITRLEREQSAIVAETFPHIAAPRPAGPAPSGPCLPSLEELERSRDRLAGRVQELRGLASDRAEHERRARQQLERMKLEPGRYKFVRLPVSDLGQGGCGVWEVRPRLGLIGMLAGWWQVKLSSGCPLPRGRRPRRGPFPQT